MCMDVSFYFSVFKVIKIKSENNNLKKKKKILFLFLLIRENFLSVRMIVFVF
jgi:hypothetical protein